MVSGSGQSGGRGPCCLLLPRHWHWARAATRRPSLRDAFVQFLVNGNGLNANTNLRNLGLFLEKYLVLLSSA